MDISSVDAISQANLQSQISVKVARKTLDATKAEGEAAVELIKAAGQVGKGGVDAAGHIDIHA